MNSESIEDYILKNERNLRNAAAVAAAWRQARQRLVKEFFKRLEAALRKKLKGWEFKLWGDYFDEDYPGFYLWKSPWEYQYYVNLECYNYGEKMIFGISREEAHIKGRPLSDELLAAVRQAFPSARARSPWWEAEIAMQTPEKDWRKPEVLWRMHKDKKFLEAVAGQLVEVAKISEPVLDRLALKK